MKRRFALSVLACTTLPLLAQAPPSVTGTWSTQTEVQGIAVNETCDLQQTGADLTGTCDTPGGKFKLTGKVNGMDVNFTHPAAYQQQEMTVSFFGKLDAPGSITGSIDMQPINAGGAFAMKKIK